MQTIKVKDGRGYCRRYNSGHSQKDAGGGAGTIGGNSWTATGNIYGVETTTAKGENGTGGLLIIYANDMINNGNLTSAGSRGGQNKVYDHSTCGGSSGGGSINVFYKNSISGANNMNAAGGTGVASTSSGGTSGAGGEGSITVTKVAYTLNYEEKEIVLDVGEKYGIDNQKISYQTLNNTQINYNLGQLKFEIIDENIASINENGEITAIREGRTKAKITDTNSNISTYIFIKVVNGVAIDIQEGKNFTIALKQNGTVWSYGLNTSGELGIGNNENKTKPEKVEALTNIKQISTGNSHTLALTKDGEVYAWGQGTAGQLGNGEKANSNLPVKVQGLSNIIKIEAYKNKSFAIDKDGNLYSFGEGYSILSMKIISNQKIADISGSLVLARNGKVYNITDMNTAIANLHGIAKISCGEAHYLALDVNGILYAWGTNTNGECGTQGKITTEIARDVMEISAGNGTSILQTNEGKVYVLGNNANGQIGLNTTAKATTPTEITLTGNVKIENISAGNGTHSGLVDENGFVWHTGTNTNGELGIGDNTDRKVYTKTGDTIVKVNQNDTIYLDLGESTNIYGTLENTFNLKIDLVDDVQDNFTLTSSNSGVLSMSEKIITAAQYRKNNTNSKAYKHRKIKRINSSSSNENGQHSTRNKR